MTDAELMMDIFRGSDLAFGRTEMSGQITAKGKHETKSWTEKRPVSLKDWERHLAGEAGIGIPPLTSENTTRFGAIDVDVYQGLSIEEVNTKIQRIGLPLILCRSKSGGPHIYNCLKEPVPASEMIERMEAYAALLGFGSSEIFPKQAMVAHSDKNPDFGSWINMPYFGGTRFLRYALDHENKAITTIAAFHAYVEVRRQTAEEFRNFKVPEPEPTFPDGPPCLNQLFATPPSEFRNILLANAAVYLKKAHKEEWVRHLDGVNARFATPLPSNEVEAIKKSYAKTEYRFQCQTQPLCNFCNSSKCRQQKFGISDGNNLPNLRSLTKVLTSPVIWYLDMKDRSGRDVRISLSSEELQNPLLFQRRCMEAISMMPSLPKRDDWQKFVDQMMTHVSVIDIPPEMSPAGQFQELMHEFLDGRASESSIEDLLRGLPFRDSNFTYFRMKDLLTFLRQQRFDALKTNEIAALLNRIFKADKSDRIIAGRHVRFIRIPLERSAEPVTPLATPQFQTAY